MTIGFHQGKIRRYYMVDFLIGGVVWKNVLKLTKIMDVEYLKFLIKLYECRNHRVYLANWKNFVGKNEICDQLQARGLVDFTQTIATVKITPDGQALLSSKTRDLSISLNELKVLQKISRYSEIAPTRINLIIKGKSMSAQERNSIIGQFCDSGLISATTKRKREQCEVWLTQEGLDCLKQVNDYFMSWQEKQSHQKKTETVLTDGDILQTITRLDQELRTNNYLPIFHLRRQLESSLSREYLDQALYRLQEQDKIELSTLAEVKAYSPEEIKAGIPQPVGGSLFFIIVN